MGLLVLQSYLFYKERQKLLDRIMAKNFEEYNFNEKIMPEEIKETKKLRDEARDVRSQEVEIEEAIDTEFKAEKEFVEGLEEDYTGEEIDWAKLRRKLASK